MSIDPPSYFREVHEHLSEIAKEICDWEGLDVGIVFRKPEDLREILRELEKQVYGLREGLEDKEERHRLDRLRLTLRWLKQILNTYHHSSKRSVDAAILAVSFAASLESLRIECELECSSAFDGLEELRSSLFASVLPEYTAPPENPERGDRTEIVGILYSLNDKISRIETAIKMPTADLEEALYLPLSDEERREALLRIRNSIAASAASGGRALKAYEHLIQYRRLDELISAEPKSIEALQVWAASAIRGYALNRTVIDWQIEEFGDEIIKVLNR